jgi:hypothetical protein
MTQGQMVKVASTGFSGLSATESQAGLQPAASKGMTGVIETDLQTGLNVLISAALSGIAENMQQGFVTPSTGFVIGLIGQAYSYQQESISATIDAAVMGYDMQASQSVLAANIAAQINSIGRTLVADGTWVADGSQIPDGIHTPAAYQVYEQGTLGIYVDATVYVRAPSGGGYHTQRVFISARPTQNAQDRPAQIEQTRPKKLQEPDR